jgi:hypothetical protein
MEENVDRRGLDYQSSELPLSADAGECRKRCASDPQCRAWTYVKPGFQGSAPRCWLKYGIPQGQPNECCVSGVKTVLQSSMSQMQWDQKLPERGDDRSFNLAEDNPGICQEACRRDAKCRAWTYVRPRPKSWPSCRLIMAERPQAVRDACCVSGFKLD